MHKSEIYTTATVAGAWLAHVWNDYLMPMLQGSCFDGVEPLQRLDEEKSSFERRTFARNTSAPDDGS